MKLSRLAVLPLLVLCLALSGCQTPWQPKQAGLQVVTGDTPAALYMDGQYIEKSPYVNKALKAGEHTLRIEPEDSKLLPHDMNITLRPGLLTVVTWRPGERPELSAGVTYELEPIQGKQSELHFVSIPDNAIVTVNGQPKTFAPATLKLSPGEYEFEVSLPSYQTQKHNVKLAAGFRTTVSVTLAKSKELTAGSTTGPAASPASTASATIGARLASASAQLQGNSLTASGSGGISSGSKVSTVTTGSRVKILPTDYRVGGVEGLRVRSAASGGATEVGFAPTGSTYAYAGETQSTWYAITFEGQKAWVSAQFSQLIKD